MSFFKKKRLNLGRENWYGISLKDLIAKNKYEMRFFLKNEFGKGKLIWNFIKGFNCLKEVWNEIFFLKKKIEFGKGKLMWNFTKGFNLTA